MEDKKKTHICKANMVRKYGEEAQTIKAEVELHKKLKNVKRDHSKKKNDQVERSSKMSRENAVKLMQKYEREAKIGIMTKGNKFVYNLTRLNIKESTKYISMLSFLFFKAKEKVKELEEKTKCMDYESKNKDVEKEKKSSRKSRGITDEELKDHIFRIVQEKSQKSLNAPFSMEDIIRQNQNLQMDNNVMKKQLEEMKRENRKLISETVKYRKQNDSVLVKYIILQFIISLIYFCYRLKLVPLKIREESSWKD